MKKDFKIHPYIFEFEKIIFYILVILFATIWVLALIFGDAMIYYKTRIIRSAIFATISISIIHFMLHHIFTELRIRCLTLTDTNILFTSSLKTISFPYTAVTNISYKKNILRKKAITIFAGTYVINISFTQQNLVECLNIIKDHLPNNHGLRAILNNIHDDALLSDIHGNHINTVISQLLRICLFLPLISVSVSTLIWEISPFFVLVWTFCTLLIAIFAYFVDHIIILNIMKQNIKKKTFIDTFLNTTSIYSITSFIVLLFILIAGISFHNFYLNLVSG